MSNTITFPFLALEDTIFLFLFSFSIATYVKVWTLRAPNPTDSGKLESMYQSGDSCHLYLYFQ